MVERPRPIFEEVETPDREAPVKGAIDRDHRGSRRLVRGWLILLFALVALMIAVGGLTRLTDSGLSITEWRPVAGAVPPLNAADWDAEFELYRQIPEYREQNAGMSLAEFKTIYWWEWGHRMLGRVIGLVWAVGFFGMWAAGKLPRGWTGRLLLLGVLGGLQGAIGWWMVSSGLEEGMLDVASYRLAVHLGLAFVIFGLISWYVFRLGRRGSDLLQSRRHGNARLFRGATGLMHLAFLQILLGALVAGIDAGRAFPTWPLMGDGWLPPDPFQITPLWRNFFEDAGLVQFVHRVTGYALAILALVVWARARTSGNARTRSAFHLMLGMVGVQIALGIVTVLYSAPWLLAILHQIGAVALWVMILHARFLSRYPVAQSVRG